MAEYLPPGVFIEEIPSGIKPIEGVGTSTGAFVGHAEKGPIGEATPINNFSQFQEKFGGYVHNGFLAFAVNSFFDEGGKSCYVVRTCDDYVGDANLGSGLHAFDKVDGINIVAIPEAVDREVHIGGMAYCARRADCFYVADSQQAPRTADEVLNYRLAQGLYSGGNAMNSKYGALYTPWIYVFDPRTGGRILIPPSGAVAGRYASTDSARGVYKAPAGIESGRLRSALDVGVEFTTAEQEKLNANGINVVRTLKGVGHVLWGARTVSSDPEWRYVNIRRLVLFLEKSIKQGTSWVVFEPNDRSLWESIVRNVSAFLRLQWRVGALVGETQEQAFYVKCDEETNPRESIGLGRVITEIGVAPSRPAEFVIFRIQQCTRESQQ